LPRSVACWAAIEIAAFSSSANPEVLPALRLHLEALVAEVCRLLGGDGELAFVPSYARTRAQQRFPLEALLHTYRCSHRVITSWIRDAALATADPAAQVRRVVAAAADFAIEYIDAISTLATSVYVEHTRMLAEAEGDRRTELLTTLLSGYDESDSRTAQLLRRSGYLEQRQSFCVAVARSVDPREMDNPARAQRMVEALGQALHNTPVRSLSGVRDGLVTMVISGTRRMSGWTAPQSLLAERIYPRLEQVGPAALIGLSNDAPSTSHVRRAHNEARFALDFATVANRVIPYAEIPFRQMLLRHARDNADANMNALQTAKDLSIHANTVYSRMQKIADITGKNALGYHDLTELLLALECDAGHQGRS